MNFSPGEARWSRGISSWKLIFILQADFWIIFLNYLMSISSYTIENTIVIPCIPSFNCVLPSKATFPLDWFLHTKTSSEVVLAPCFELQFWSDTNLNSAFCQSISSVVVTETQTILNLKRELSGFFIWEVQDYYWLQKWLDLRIQTMSPFIFPFPAFFCGLCLNQDSLSMWQRRPSKPLHQAVVVHTCGLFVPASETLGRSLFSLSWQRSWVLRHVIR